mmetsp:Transcript_12372/g.34750  ORF Transcript_12372/g.34750 Transcript_12372/m.34750 type:complete len:304 (-) Transcript_12372:285-1196(-)
MTGALRSTVRFTDSSGTRCTPSALHCSVVLYSPCSRKCFTLNMLILALVAAGTRMMGILDLAWPLTLRWELLLLGGRAELVGAWDEACGRLLLWWKAELGRGGGGGCSSRGPACSACLRCCCCPCRPYGLMPSVLISFTMAACCMSLRSKRPEGLMGRGAAMAPCFWLGGFGSSLGRCSLDLLACLSWDDAWRPGGFMLFLLCCFSRSFALITSNTRLRFLFGVISCELRSRSSRSCARISWRMLCSTPRGASSAAAVSVAEPSRPLCRFVEGCPVPSEARAAPRRSVDDRSMYWLVSVTPVR